MSRSATIPAPVTTTISDELREALPDILLRCSVGAALLFGGGMTAASALGALLGPVTAGADAFVPSYTELIARLAAGVLVQHPRLNACWQNDGLLEADSVNLGIAVDTDAGLVVPVVRDVDTKSISQLAQETAALAAKARDGKLTPAEMQGGNFSISSLGGFGGTTFTPIINAPEVAILGVCRSAMKPVWTGSEFVPRLMLPLSLSYDHRVIDGAAAAKFNAYLAALLADFRRALV